MKKSLLQFTMIIPVILLLCFTFSCQQQVEEGITEEEAKALSESTLEIWNEGNLAVVDEVYDPDYVRHYVDIYEDIVGIDAYKKWITDTRTAFPDFNVTPEGEIIAKADKIVGRWIAEGTQTGPLASPSGELPPTGKKVRFFGVIISHIANGKIVEDWLYFNQASSLQQLGFTLTPPQPPAPQEKE
jgi:predicted ester cyclase